MTTHNWENYGIRWDSEDVCRRADRNGASKVVIGQAQIPVLTNLEKFRANVTDADAILRGIWDGTSVRVQAQDVARHALDKGKKDADTMRELVWNRIIGIRTRTVSVKSYALPGKTERYTGTNLMEYRQAYAAALVDGGVDAAMSTALASTITF